MIGKRLFDVIEGMFKNADTVGAVQAAAWTDAEDHYRADNCSTKNEYIEKAIRLYSGYLDTEHADSYLSHVLSEALDQNAHALQKCGISPPAPARKSMENTACSAATRSRHWRIP